MIEPASASHTLQILPDGTDDAILFIRLGGDVQLLDAEDRVVGVENWRTAVSRCLDYCRAHDIAPRDITGLGCGEP